MNKHEIIINFLKKNRCLRKARANFKREDTNLEDWINVVSIREDLIYRTFTWNNTPEGTDYWSKIQRKWEKYYESTFSTERSNKLD